MGIGMMRRHYGNEEGSATVHLDPQPIDESNVEGGVVAIGDEPGTAPTPTVADSAGREFDQNPSKAELEGQGEAPDANEKGASADQHGDPEHTVDPVGHPVDEAKVAENLDAKGAPHGDVLNDEHPDETETAPEVPAGVEVTRPAKSASRAKWAAYAEAVGVAVADTEGRDDIAARFLDAE
jgi:hypothetical protein